MDRLIDPDKLMMFCGCHDIYQSAYDGELLVVIGQTSRGDDTYRSLYDFDEIYADEKGHVQDD